MKYATLQSWTPWLAERNREYPNPEREDRSMQRAAWRQEWASEIFAAAQRGDVVPLNVARSYARFRGSANAAIALAGAKNGAAIMRAFQTRAWPETYATRTVGRSNSDGEENAGSVPTLDTMEPEALMVFWSRYSRGAKRSDCEALLGSRFDGYTNVANDLSCYAVNKATAMRCRKEGKLESAEMYEAICERIYRRLPPVARW